jgi:hypothetical protein
MQNWQERQAADARLSLLSATPARLAVVFGASLTLLHVFIVLQVAFLMTGEGGTRTLESDFRVFWAAARLVLGGEPLAPFDLGRLAGEYGTATDSWMPWLYPPGYLVLVAPLGLLPYAMAYLAMTLLSLLAMALAARAFAGGLGPVWAAMVLAPAFLPALIIGQNSLIWLAVLLAALACLRGGRAVLAGLLIGCLTLKPQLGLMIPFALLAAGQWRTILAAGGTALVLAGLPTLLTGAEYWSSLAAILAQHAERMVSLAPRLDLTVGPVFLAAQAGLAMPQALALQWGLMTLVALSVLVFWHSGRVGFDAKAGLLMLSILISAPYLWYYECALMAAAGLFLVRAGILSRHPAHLVLLALLWIGAGWQSWNVFLHLVPDRYLGAPIVTPVLFLAFFLCWVHYFARHRGAEVSA